MFFVYILKSEKDGNLYIGKTNDVKRRLFEHNSGKVSSTKARRPFSLLQITQFDSEELALQAEKEYKKGCRREEIRKRFGL